MPGTLHPQPRQVRCAFLAGVLLLLCPVLAQAQYTSRLGRFQVDENKGCAPLTVTVTNLLGGKCTPGDPCDFDYEGNNQFVQNSFTFTYTTPGTYKLTVLYQTIGTDDITITVTKNIKPSFDIYTCSGNQAEVKITDTNYQQYVINFNDGSPVTVVPSGSFATAMHTYASSGNKSITVRGRDLNADDNCNPNTQNFTALNTLPTPALNKLAVLSQDSAVLNVTAANHIEYRLEVATNGSSSFQLIKTLYNVTADTLTQLNTESNYYCFRLGAVDPCANTVTYSNTLCSLKFDLAVQSGQNVLSWQTDPTGINFYSINRNQNSYTAVNATSFSDDAVICGNNYCYQVTSVYANGSKSISIENCGTAISTATPPSVNDVSTVVTDKGVDLSWSTDSLLAVEEYQIARGPQNGITTFYTSTTQPSFTDPSFNPNDSYYCYRIKYTDKCGNDAQPGVDVCPIQLTASLTKENYVSLKWTAYDGWQSGVASYTIEKRDEKGQLLQTFDAGPATDFVDDIVDLQNQTLTYVVTALPNDNKLTPSVSNAVTIIKDPKLFFPTAFTPDQIGPPQNETFKVFGQFISAIEMKIFNRWGELLFVSNDIATGWDGTYNGVPQPEGVYVFRARITDLDGRQSVKSGSVVLLRKNK